jgi:hypothetical protein
MLSATGRSPLVEKLSVSAERYEAPTADRTAPPVADELLHPRPEPPGGFEHGHGITPATPGSHRLVKPADSRSWRKMSMSWFVSPPTRLLETLQYVTYRPSAEIEGNKLLSLPSAVSESTLTRTVVPKSRSRTKTSIARLPSLLTRSPDWLKKATNRPSAEMEGDGYWIG